MGARIFSLFLVLLGLLSADPAAAQNNNPYNPFPPSRKLSDWPPGGPMQNGDCFFGNRGGASYCITWPPAALPLATSTIPGAVKPGTNTSIGAGGALNVTITGVPPSGGAGGDLFGSYPNPDVVKVHGVVYPASPATNKVPVVTSSNTVTYEAVPNVALANSSVNVVAGSGLTGGGNVALGGTITLSASGGSSTLGTSTTAASPAISGDATSGFYTAGASKVDVVIAGSKVTEWGTTGQAVTGTLSSSSALLLTSTAAAGAGQTGIHSLVANSLSLVTTGTDALIVTATGSIGIGTTAPAFLLDVAGTTRATGQITAASFVASSTSGVIGTTTNNNAAAGSVGEVISSFVASPGSSISNTTFTDITSISLTAGDWDVWGSIAYAPAGGTAVTEAYSSISSISATPGTGGTAGRAVWRGTFTGGNPMEVPSGMVRISVASTTTIYLVGYLNFSVSTATAYGQIVARRRR